MQTEPKSLKSPQLTAYIVGFVLSIICTLIVYGLVNKHVSSNHSELSHHFLIAVIMIFALVQLFVQLIFFLHLGRENKPRWNLYALLFTGLIVTIFVAGTLWIMAHLNYNMQLENQRDDGQSIIEDEGIQVETQHDHDH